MVHHVLGVSRLPGMRRKEGLDSEQFQHQARKRDQKGFLLSPVMDVIWRVFLQVQSTWNGTVLPKAA